MTCQNKLCKKGLLVGGVLLAAAIWGGYHVLNGQRSSEGLGQYVQQCNEDEAPLECRSVSAIESAFGVHLPDALNDIHARMRQTAEKIAGGEMTMTAYSACLDRGDCAPVPMLPPEIDPESAQARTPENARISAMFWDLVEKDGMSDDLCAFIPACALALGQGVVVVRDGRVAVKDSAE